MFKLSWSTCGSSKVRFEREGDEVTCRYPCRMSYSSASSYAGRERERERLRPRLDFP